MPTLDVGIDYALPRTVRQRAYDAAHTRTFHSHFRDVVSVDGEGITQPDGRHDFTLLADSLGNKLTGDPHVELESALRFLLDKRGSLVVGFAFTYDATKIVEDLRPGRKMKLHRNGYVYWQGPSGSLYRIGMISRKTFTVSEILDKKTIRSVTVWDTFGFYQTSFVKALTMWGVGTPTELAELSSMKGLRSGFSVVDTDRITAYNDLECRLLVDLTERLRATIEKTGYRLRRWDGAGALASAMLMHHGVKQHRSDTEVPDAVMSAYFGGRIQVCQLGIVPGPVHAYDITSAYPSVIADLPSLKGATWRYVTEYQPNPYALWHVQWCLQTRVEKTYPNGLTVLLHSDKDMPILTPFPVRAQNHNIHYPIIGEGWYWGPLVDLAMTHWKGVRVVGGYVPQLSNDTKPFGWVRDVFTHRREYKRQNDPRHIVLKLGLNAVYGKLAQGVSWRDTRPAYTDYVWAGLITSTTQSKLLSAAIRKPASVIAFATDGLYTTSETDVTIGSGLGEWEHAEYDGMTIVQPGLYRLHKGAERIDRSRGYFTEEVKWDHLEALWRRAGPFASYDFVVNRFLSLGIALQTHQIRKVGRWIDSPRSLALRPATGFPGVSLGAHHIRWEPDYLVDGGGMSRPFEPKRSKYDLEQELGKRWNEEQPDPIV